jgi:tRNA (guanine37-N1)-methyltransferase
MKFSVITIFPELITNYTSESIIGRAQQEEYITVDTYDPRNYTNDTHDSVDAPPYGGGPGMVMQAKPILKAVKAATDNPNETGVVIFAVDGNQFSNEAADDLLDRYEHVILVCGRYEGIDARVKQALCRASEFGCENVHAISIGLYTLTGGELPALVTIDATTRRIPGVLGDEKSLEENRVASSEVYTRPQSITYNDHEFGVPDVLLSGHHEKIQEWRKKKSEPKGNEKHDSDR